MQIINMFWATQPDILVEDVMCCAKKSARKYRRPRDYANWDDPLSAAPVQLESWDYITSNKVWITYIAATWVWIITTRVKCAAYNVNLVHHCNSSNTSGKQPTIYEYSNDLVFLNY